MRPSPSGRRRGEGHEALPAFWSRPPGGCRARSSSCSPREGLSGELGESLPLDAERLLLVNARSRPAHNVRLIRRFLHGEGYHWASDLSEETGGARHLAAGRPPRTGILEGDAARLAASCGTSPTVRDLLGDAAGGPAPLHGAAAVRRRQHLPLGRAHRDPHPEGRRRPGERPAAGPAPEAGGGAGRLGGRGRGLHPGHRYAQGAQAARPRQRALLELQLPGRAHHARQPALRRRLPDDAEGRPPLRAGRPAGWSKCSRRSWAP